MGWKHLVINSGYSEDVILSTIEVLEECIFVGDQIIQKNGYDYTIERVLEEDVIRLLREDEEYQQFTESIIPEAVAFNLIQERVTSLRNRGYDKRPNKDAYIKDYTPHLSKKQEDDGPLPNIKGIKQLNKERLASGQKPMSPKEEEAARAKIRKSYAFKKYDEVSQFRYSGPH